MDELEQALRAQSDLLDMTSSPGGVFVLQDSIARTGGTLENGGAFYPVGQAISTHGQNMQKI